MTNQFRIVLLSAHYPPDQGGISDYTHFLANGLASVGSRVEVLTSVGLMDPEQYPLATGVHVRRVVRNWGFREVIGLVRTIRSLPKCAIIIQYAPHAFSRRGIVLVPSLLPLAIRLLTQHRVIVNFHELYIAFGPTWRHFLGALWQRAMAVVIAATAHGLMATSSEWPGRLQRIGVRKAVTVVPVGSNIPLLEISDDQRTAVRRSLGVAHELVIGCLGSIAPKDDRLLVDAAASVSLKWPMKVIWLGNAGGRWATPDARVTWTGPLPHRELSRLMSACDVIALPFRDGISARRTTVAAALLHGLPVLATKGRALDAFFVDDQNMLLTGVGDLEAFTRALGRLAADRHLRERLGRQARTLHDAEFGWDVIARRVVEVASGVMEPTPRQRP